MRNASMSKEGSDDLERRILELESLFEASRILNSSLQLSSVLDTLLLTAMGRFLLSRGLVGLIRDGQLRVESVKGAPSDMRGRDLGPPCELAGPTLLEAKPIEPACLSLLSRWGFSLVLPLTSGRRELGLVAFGPKHTGEGYQEHEISFLEALARIAATAVENALVVEELAQANRQLDRKLQEMNTLFELSAELNASLDEKQIAAALCYALMGEMLTNTCIVWQLAPDDGLRTLAAFGPGDLELPVEELNALANWLASVREPVRLQPGEGAAEETEGLSASGIRVVVPLWVQDRACGAVALGKRMDGRDYSDDDLSFLQTLSNHAANSLENARLFRESLEKQRIEEELKIARDIQLRLLPREYPRVPGVDVWGLHKPSRWVAGDYLDTVGVSSSELAFVIADVSGKGVPASLLMANVQAGFRTLLGPGADLAELCARLNRLVYENTDFDKFVTLFMAMLDVRTGALQYVNAGHNPPYLVRRGGHSETLDVGGLLLGMMPDVPYAVGEVQLQPGDLLFLFTDGVVEAQDAGENEFSEERLLALLRDLTEASAEQVCQKVLEAVEAFAGDQGQYDDITMLAVRIER